MPEIYKQTVKGLELRIKVIPNAPKSMISGVENGELKIRLSAVPEKGKANEALCKYLAKVLGISGSRVKLLSGDTNRHKRVLVEGYVWEEFVRVVSLSGLNN